MKAFVTSLAFLAALAVPAIAVEPLSHDTQVNANAALRNMIQTKTGAVNYTSTSFVQVTGGSIVIPPAQQGILVATFTAESICTGGFWCSVRIICDGVELNPIVGTDFAFNSPGTTWKSLSVTRRSNVLAAGSHFCEVQAASVGAATHRLDDWTFMVSYWRTP